MTQQRTTGQAATRCNARDAVLLGQVQAARAVGAQLQRLPGDVLLSAGHVPGVFLAQHRVDSVLRQGHTAHVRHRGAAAASAAGRRTCRLWWRWWTWRRAAVCPPTWSTWTRTSPTPARPYASGCPWSLRGTTARTRSACRCSGPRRGQRAATSSPSRRSAVSSSGRRSPGRPSGSTRLQLHRPLTSLRRLCGFFGSSKIP